MEADERLAELRAKVGVVCACVCGGVCVCVVCIHVYICVRVHVYICVRMRGVVVFACVGMRVCIRMEEGPVRWSM